MDRDKILLASGALVAMLVFLVAMDAHAASARQAVDAAQTAAPRTDRADRDWDGQRRLAANHAVRLSRMIGLPVEDRTGRRIGDVADVILDPQRGRVEWAVIETTRAGDLDGRHVALPIDSLAADARRDRLLAGVFAAEVRNLAPTVDRTHSGLRRGSDLFDAELRDASGEDVGHVEDVVVDLDTGRIRYAVGEFDPSWFMSGKLVVVPLQDVYTAGARDKLVIRVDRERLHEAPAFDIGRWPDVNDPGFRAQVQTYAARLERFAERVGKDLREEMRG